jgi:hypothetical protein
MRWFTTSAFATLNAGSHRYDKSGPKNPIGNNRFFQSPNVVSAINIVDPSCRIRVASSVSNEATRRGDAGLPTTVQAMFAFTSKFFDSVKDPSKTANPP